MEPITKLVVGALFLVLPTLIFIIMNSTIGTHGSLNLIMDLDTGTDMQELE